MYIQAVDTLTAIIKKNIIKLNKNISIKSNNIRLTEVVLNARLQENLRVVYTTFAKAHTQTAPTAQSHMCSYEIVQLVPSRMKACCLTWIISTDNITFTQTSEKH